MRLEVKHPCRRSPVHRPRTEGDSLRGPARGERLRTCAEGVSPDADTGRGVVPSEELLELLRAPDPGPSLNQPCRMRPARRRIGLAQARECGPDGVPFANRPAQERVDETALMGTTCAATKLNGIVHRRVVRDPIEPEQLVEAQPQRFEHPGVLGSGSLASGDEPVQCGPPAQHTKNQFPGKPAVRRAEGAKFGIGVHPMFREIPGRPMEHRKRNANCLGAETIEPAYCPPVPSGTIFA